MAGDEQRREGEPVGSDPGDLCHAILTSALDAIVVADEDGRILDFNPAAEAMFGHARAEVVGQPLADTIVPARHRAAHRAGMKRYLATGERRIMGRRAELEALCADGRVLPVELTVTEVDAGNGRLFAAHLRDLSQRRSNEEELKASEARFRSIVEDQIEFISRFTAEFRLTFINRAYAEQLGRPREEILGTCLLDLMTAEQATRFTAQLAALTPESSVISYEMETVLPDGTPGVEHWTDRALFDEAGRLVEYQSVGRDVTELRRASAEIARQRDALHQSEKLAALGSLLAGVAHELNNPLSVVMGRAALLEETVTDEAARRSVIKLREAAERCARIVRTFLAMARQEPREPGPADLRELIESALALLGYGLTAGGVEVVLELEPDLPSLFGDADQLQQLFVNLIVNAQQALQGREPPRLLTIVARNRRDGLEITVADNGGGVPDEIKGRIFEPFFTTKPQGYGTGIGLALCHSVTIAHGGTIAIEDRAGGGALFRVRLPLPMPGAPAPAAMTAAEPAAGGPGRGGRILVIDDEPEVILMLRDVLAADGHEVTGVGSGGAALGTLDRGQRFDLVISDYRMADLDGRALHAALERRHGELARRLIFITGDSSSPDIQDTLVTSGCACVEKPFTPDEVRRVVRSHFS